MSNKTRYCLFCGDTNYVMAKEHVIALCLLEHLGLKRHEFLAMLNKRITSYESNQNTGEILYEITRVRNHAMSSLVHGGVCKPCNSGWMSWLETEAFPILTSLMSNDRLISGLDEREKLIISRWATKTAYSLYFSMGGLTSIPIGHARALHPTPHDPVPWCIVVGAQFPVERPFDFYCSSDWNTHLARLIDVREYESVIRASYKISFQIQALHLMICFIGDPGWKYELEEGTHFLLMGSEARVVRLAPNVSPDWNLIPSHLRHELSVHRYFHSRLKALLP